jgi:Dna[CI] antecedent, DciA
MRVNKPKSINELLIGPSAALQGLLAKTEAADAALVAVRAGLPANLRDRVWGAAIAGEALTVLVDSPAWASRVRYALPEAKPSWTAQLGPIRRVVVKVRPRR